jgi:hypothetical protein
VIKHHLGRFFSTPSAKQRAREPDLFSPPPLVTEKRFNHDGHAALVEGAV